MQLNAVLKGVKPVHDAARRAVGVLGEVVGADDGVIVAIIFVFGVVARRTDLQVKDGVGLCAVRDSELRVMILTSRLTPTLMSQSDPNQSCLPVQGVCVSVEYTGWPSTSETIIC